MTVDGTPVGWEIKVNITIANDHQSNQFIHQELMR